MTVLCLIPAATCRPHPPSILPKHTKQPSSCPCPCLHQGKLRRSLFWWTLLPAVLVLGTLQACLNLNGALVTAPLGLSALASPFSWALAKAWGQASRESATVNSDLDGADAGMQGSSLAEGARAEVRSQAAKIHEGWAHMFKLDQPGPPKTVPAPTGGGGGIPWAPHLEECTELQAQRDRAERHPEARGYPEWACAEEGGAHCSNPTPPWIRGEDKDNLPMTRRVQRDLWVHQFPRNCSDPSLGFLIVEWADLESHGMGSQIHIMTAALSLAIHFGRILVPSAYLRADHGECQGVGQLGSWECYFSRITSEQCMQEAWRLVEEQKLEEPSWDVMSVYNQSRVVWVTHDASEQAATPMVDRFWGKPWENHSAPFYEELGSAHRNSSIAHLIWWRSQALRFMMRWPSAYLCHLTNRARHQSYGAFVALEVADAQAEQSRIQQDSNSRLSPPEREALLSAWGEGATPLETDREWRMRGRDGAYMPRPIVSMHVRQGDKAREMQLFEFESYMWMANRVRRMQPGIQYIWLSTEMQSVVDAAQEHKDWTFFYTQAERQSSLGMEMREYEIQRGVQDLAGNSFANLIISAECDAFVGVLGSNWNRMINELRLTSGRMNAGYFTLNNGHWG